jgi:iron(III) transport system substrate-binding protein
MNAGQHAGSRASRARAGARSSTSLAAVSAVALLLAACGGSNEPSGSGGSGDVPATFDTDEGRALIEEASGQSLQIITHPTDEWAAVIEAFEETFPDISVEVTGSRPSDISPRVISEQSSGVFQWDVMFAATSNMTNVLIPAGAFTELTDYLTIDDVAQDEDWGGGFGFYSTDEPLVLVTGAENISATVVNRDLAPDFDSLEDLADPSLRGQIVFDDCTVPAHAVQGMVSIRQAAGQEVVETLLNEQDVTFLDNFRTVTEAVARGEYAVGIGGDDAVLRELQETGIGENVEMIEMPEGAVNLTTTGIGVFRDAPNPQAAELFVNWFLSQDGQEAYVEAFGQAGAPANSRRLDVTVGDETTAVPWDGLDEDQLFAWTTSSGKTEVQEAIALCREVRGQ